jgi:hypothetical protein
MARIVMNARPIDFLRVLHGKSELVFNHEGTKDHEGGHRLH